MTILEGNIKLLKSQVMDDVDEGGGRATGNAIADGASNAIFADISELDRAYGRVNLRKTFVSVDTPDTDGYFGANVIIADPPDDERVSCALFTTEDGFDRRVDAQSRLEAYVISGPRSSMAVYGNQIAGQRAILAYQRLEQPLPEVGDVYVIGTETGTIVQQFFRIIDVVPSIQTFEDASGLFDRRVITLTISDALRQTFTGAEPIRFSSAETTTAKLRKTSVADASRYYGTRPLEEAAEVGDLTIKADTIYTPLVPSSQLETPIVLGEIRSPSTVIASGAAITLSSATWAGAARTLYLRDQVTPTSVTLSIGSANDYWPKTDNGVGDIVTPSGAVVGSVDYTTGVLTPDTTQVAAWSSTSSASITYTPGTNLVQSAFTRGVQVTLATRGSVYVETLTPVPAAGTLTLDFMALGKWYRLQDNGSGVLQGSETAFGTGTVNYSTGAVVVTLGALPDVGSGVMYAWGSPVDTRVRTTGTSSIVMRATTSENTAARSSVTVVYTKGGATKTLTETGTGVLSGSGQTGTIKYATGEIVIDGTRDPSTDITVDYSYGDALTEHFDSPARSGGGGTVTVSLPNTPLLVRSIKLMWNVQVDMYSDNSTRFSAGASSYTVSAEDDGSGNLKLPDGTTVGTVNYTTGAVTWQPDVSIALLASVYQMQFSAGFSFGGITVPDRSISNFSGRSYISLPGVAASDFNVDFTYRSTDSPTTTTETFNSPLEFDIVPGTSETLLPDGLYFTLTTSSGASTYVDHGGTLYRDSSLTAGGGSEAGTIDYTAARVSVTSWPSSLVSSPLSVQSALTVLDGSTATQASFRTAGAPIRPASLYVQATATDGSLITGTSDQSGTISGAFMRGAVDNTTGMVFVEFGSIVTASGNEGEWWYLLANVDSGNIWKPVEVFPGTIKYNAVVVSSLPLDADIIGLDPVRLPADGRVPIFRAGNIAVVHHTATKAPQTVSNGQTVDLLRTRLSRVRVIGNDGVTITTGYTADLDAGTVLFSDITGYSQPIHIENRIEDMALVSDAQINGTMSITRQLTHDFPEGSYVSSALIIGDMRARVPILFDQATWVGTSWANTINGSAATATFNDVLAPIEVTNQGAITERWIVQFTNTTSFNVIGEHVGVIATGNTGTDCAPNNPATGVPYFTLLTTGWGSGWSAGNVLRFNTVGALFPVWIARTIQQGAATEPDDAFTVLVRGDIDRP